MQIIDNNDLTNKIKIRFSAAKNSILICNKRSNLDEVTDICNINNKFGIN